MDAAREDDYFEVKRLLDEGDDPNQVHPEHGITALMCACECASINAIDVMLQHSSVNIDMRDPDGYTAIMHACTMGYEGKTSGIEWELFEDVVERMRNVANANDYAFELLDFIKTNVLPIEGDSIKAKVANAPSHVVNQFHCLRHMMILA